MLKQRFARFAILAMLAGMVSVSEVSNADAPSTFTWQGRLADSGTPVNGSVDVTLKLFDASTGGTELGSWGPSTISVTDGLLVVEVTDASLTSVIENQPQVWLEVDADGTTFPRQRVTSSLFSVLARKAKNADTLDNYDSSLAKAANSIYVSDGSGYLPAGVVNSAAIEDDSVYSSLIGTETISGAAGIKDHIVDGTISGADIEFGGITSSNLADDSVYSSQIGIETISGAAGSKDHIVDGSISGADIEFGGITSSNLADDSVYSSQIGTETISGAAGFKDHIVDGSISGADIEFGGITSSNLADDSVYSSQVAISTISGAVGSKDHIVDGTIGGADLADDAIGATKLQNDSDSLSKVTNGLITVGTTLISFDGSKELDVQGVLSVTGDTFLSDASTGFLGVGGAFDGTGTYELDVTGDIRCVSLLETSGARYKDDVNNITEPLEKIDQLRGVTFTWNHPSQEGKRDLGFIAEEVATVIPEVVHMNEEGTEAMAMDYTHLMPLAMEGIKALREENRLLRQQLEMMQQRLDNLEASK